MAVTIRDVAREARVSIATVSRALSSPDQVAEATRSRVQAVAARLGYRPNSNARSLITGRRGSIGLLVPDLENPFFGSVCKGVQARARAAGYTVFVADTEEDPTVETEIVRGLIKQVDGVILCSSRTTDDEIRTLAEQTPLVLANRELSGIRSIIFDNVGAVDVVLGHLVALGHRRIAYAGGPVRSWSSRQRADAFVRFAGNRENLDLVELGNFPPYFTGGLGAADLAVASGATAVVAFNDIMALGIIDRLRQRGLRAPDDVSVTGFDNVAVSTYVHPNLTTVDLPRVQMGRLSVDALLDAVLGRQRASDPELHEIAGELVVRQSTGEPPGGATTDRPPTEPTETNGYPAVTHPRLTLAALETLPPELSDSVLKPSIDPRQVTIGIVHFGIGAFHRAHQAVFTEDAMHASGERGWGILGVTARSDAVVEQLKPQDCLYGVLERGTDAARLRLVASVRDVVWPGVDSERVVEALAAPTTQLATLTITEKGYLRAADGGADLSLPAVQSDIALILRELAEAVVPQTQQQSQTPLGLLVRGLARRFMRGGEPFTVVPCDNLVDNGPTTARLVRSLAAAATAATDVEPSKSADAFAAWLQASVTFPSTMVDRITPATTEADRELAGDLLRLSDAALVVAEPFKQWVIENNFAGPRPAWERAGAILTDDVAPYERVKLRILNGSHSLLAYLGALTGHETIAQAVADEALRESVQRVLTDDILPTLDAPAGIDLEQYRDSVLERFANPNLAHTTRQVAMDGSQKLPFRFLNTVIDRLDAGFVPDGLALAVAAWITYIASTVPADGPDAVGPDAAAGRDLDDPLASTLQAAVGSAAALSADPAAAVGRVFALEAIFPARLRASAGRAPEFRAAVVAQLATVRAITAR